MDKQFLENCLKQDMSSRQIAKLKEVNIGARTIVWYIHKYNSGSSYSSAVPV